MSLPEYNTMELDKQDNEASKSNDETKRERPLLDHYINQAGFTAFQYKTLLITCFVLFIDGMHMTILNIVFIPFSKFFNLSDFDVSVISSLMFLSVALGSILSSYHTKVASRVKVIELCILLTFVSTLAHMISKSLAGFILCRFLVGVAVGLLMPLANNMLCEVLPTNFRSFFLILTGVFFIVGACFNCLVVYMCMPQFQPDRLNRVFIIISLPLAVFWFVTRLLIQEGPRNLIIQGKHTQAFDALERITNKTISQASRSTIVKEIEESNKTVKSSIGSMFTGPYKRISISLTFIWIANSYIVYGCSFAMSLTLKYIDSYLNQSPSTNVNQPDGSQPIHADAIIVDLMMIYLMNLPSNVLSGLMTETRLFGRKNTMAFGFFMCALFCFIGFFKLNHFALCFGLAGFFIAFALSSSNSYSCEVYPSKVRDTALGFLYFCTRVSGFASQILAIGLTNIYFLGQYIMSFLICLVGIYFVMSLPYDTYNRPLDIEVDPLKNED